MPATSQKDSTKRNHQHLLGPALTLALVLTALAPALAPAHTLFMQSSKYQVAAGKDAPLFFGYGHHFPVDDAIRREKLAYVRVLAPDGGSSDMALRDEKTLHSYLVNYEQPGTYTLVAETVPGLYAIYTDKNGRTRHTLQPLHSFIDSAAEVKISLLSRQWAKSYVICDTPSAAPPVPVGLPLELVPLRQVSGLKQGDAIELQVFQHGKPYAGEGSWDATYNGFSTESEDMAVEKSTISGGKIVLPLEASGRWYIRFSTEQPAPEDQRRDYLAEKHSATLSFEVRNDRRRPSAGEH